jgi:predicted TIM-barrel fold metal-dependent hydrolase
MRLLGRRRVVEALATLPVLPALAAPEKKTPVVDCHIHCFDGKASQRFPYHARASYRPELRSSPEDLLRCMDAAGVDFGVVVHPEPYQDDHRYLEHCLAVGGKRLRGTCLFFAERPGWQRELPALIKRTQGSVVTLRIHAYDPDRLPPFGKPELRALWKAAADLGLALQLHFEPRYAPGFEPLIKEFSKTPVIVDHLGRPLQGTPEEHAVVVGWSRFPNVHVKLSAIPPETQYPHRDIRPAIKSLLGAFGASRMISGGGYGAEGATAQSYKAAQQRLRGYVSHLPASEVAALFGGTAARLFRL